MENSHCSSESIDEIPGETPEQSVENLSIRSIHSSCELLDETCESNHSSEDSIVKTGEGQEPYKTK
jgi:hypothetical protein